MLIKNEVIFSQLSLLDDIKEQIIHIQKYDSFISAANCEVRHSLMRKTSN